MIQRRNIALYIILSIVTCGIFTYYWIYVLNEDMNHLTGDYSISGGLLIVLSIITCGIYLWYWLYKMGGKLDSLRQSRGIPSNNSGILYIILAVLDCRSSPLH